jgi:hypothetical protein
MVLGLASSANASGSYSCKYAATDGKVNVVRIDAPQSVLLLCRTPKDVEVSQGNESQYCVGGGFHRGIHSLTDSAFYMEGAVTRRHSIKCR